MFDIKASKNVRDLATSEKSTNSEKLFLITQPLSERETVEQRNWPNSTSTTQLYKPTLQFIGNQRTILNQWQTTGR